MAQGESSAWWSSWTTGILENVREKTTSALEFVQSDLSEFVSTIQHDTSVVIADSASAVNRNILINESEKEAASGKLKQGFSNILSSISTSLHQAADKSLQPSSAQDESIVDEQRTTAAMPAVYDRTQARLQEMQTNPETYRNDPNCDTYQNWIKTFDLDSKKGEISQLLVNNPDVRRIYTKFVPSIQSHATFWHRYFYKVHEIESENQRLADIVARASRNDMNDLGWDDDDDEDITVASSPYDEDRGSTVESNVTVDSESRDEVLHENSNFVVDEQSIKSKTANEINTGEINTRTEKKVSEDKNETVNNCGDNVKAVECQEESAISHRLLERTKSEEEKSDSSDSNSWIRVIDKEGASSNSSSSVVVVQEKDLDEQENDHDEDDDDDFDFNEDISNEEVEKLVQSITANDLDSGEDDWDDWE